MPGHNFTHFTGKPRPIKTQPRRKKPKQKRTHKNKYHKMGGAMKLTDAAIRKAIEAGVKEALDELTKGVTT